MKYKYNYSNSQSSIEEVEKTLKAEWTPDRCRNKNVAMYCSLSEASVNIHLHELEERGKAVRLGNEWLHIEVAKSLEVWQLRRILDSLDRKHDQASVLESRLQEKLEVRKEYLQEMKEELRSDEFKKEQKAIVELEGTRNYYTRKKERLRRDKMKVFSLIKEANSKESGSSKVEEEKLKPIAS